MAVEPFSPKHNVIVGRNGSGKSNFFYAIQFVLSDEFSHLSAEERQQLLHEGTGQRTMTAYVEIVFDNSDNRLPTDEPLVPLRRQFGVKKDEYFWCKKKHTRSEVMNMLETAGFSRSNPYYIVKQGKINQMATAPDNQRLKILKEVAGIRTFDENKDESHQLINVSRDKLEMVIGLIESIEKKLETLEGEKEELKEYQKWDKMRRAVEYSIFNNELEDSRKKQRELEERRENSTSITEKLKEKLQKSAERIKDANKEVKEVREQLRINRDEKETLQQDLGTFLKDKTRLELHIRDLIDEVEGDANSKHRAEGEMVSLREKIAERQAELNQIKPKYEEEKRREEECARLLALKQQKRSELYARQGRGSQFTSKSERDTWIQNELKSLRKNINDKKQQISRLKDDLARDARRKGELEKKIEELTQELDNNRSSIDTQNKTFYDMKKKKDNLQNERNDLWRQENMMQSSLNTLNEELAKKDHILRRLVGKTLLNGRDSVQKVLQHFREQGGQMAKIANGYYGMLIENLNCDKEFYTAVEMTAGNKLFHHVVERDDVGTKILQEMNKMRLPGEVTFMPLNRLQDRKIDYPNTKDAVPLINKVNYEKKVDVVMKFIFGKTLICRTLEVATSLAKGRTLDCITLDGDQVSHKGSLTGGYFDSTRDTRLKIHTDHGKLTKEVQEQKAKLDELLKTLADIETQINQVVSEMQKSETKNSKNKDTYDKMKADIRLLKDELSTIERSKQPKERSLMSHESSLKSMESSQESFTNEIQQDLTKELSATDQQQVNALDEEIAKLKVENSGAFSARMSLEAQKNKLENLLNNNLCRRRDELEAALHEISIEERQQKLEGERQELATIDQRIDAVSEKIQKLDKIIARNQEKLLKAQSIMEEAKREENEIIERLNEDVKDLEKISSKKSVLTKKIEDCMKKIRELGTLPSDAETKYSRLGLKQLYKKLEQCNHELQKYSHVNKKALDQYLEFSERKETLLERKQKIDAEYTAISDLINTLEQRKYNDIQTTFSLVSQHFSDVFKKLVPNGKASLVMRTADTNDSTASSLESMNRGGPVGIEAVTGVGIRVSFTGSLAEMKDMQQLSGGQKSIVALAFIFGIQKCDPAPFYLFDEIDQALDPQYRKSVAEMIHELASTAQFITTTFRPELLENADKFYGVKFRDRVSVNHHHAFVAFSYTSSIYLIFRHHCFS